MSADPSIVIRAVSEVASGAAALLDVRRDDEWEQAHAVGAVHWPLARLEAGELPPLAKDAKIYVYCAAGSRSEIARSVLSAAGYLDVTNIGGLVDWQRAGGPIE